MKSSAAISPTRRVDLCRLYALLGIVDEVLAIELADVLRAREYVIGIARLSARDALHAAVMARESIERIMTFDQAFDRVPGLSRYRA